MEEDATPIFFTPPLSLEPKKSDGGETQKQQNLLSLVLDLVRSMRPGSDLTKFQLPARFNMPKSQLQVYGESVYSSPQDLLSRCAKALSPLDRFVNVVAWHISTTRPAPLGQAPLNPILGETHHVSNGDLNVILEQVSHHPPITCLYATNTVENIEMLWWQSASPWFYGGSVEATIHGLRILLLPQHGEKYEMTSPKLLLRFFPSLGTGWVGDTTITCPQSCLQATISFKTKTFLGLRGSLNKVTGMICNSATGRVLYKLNGSWTQKVTLEDTITGQKSNLYDADTVLTNLKMPLVENPLGLASTESVVVWSHLMKAIVNRDWIKARHEKRLVEERQRSVRMQTACSSWSPKYFAATPDGHWEWLHHGQSVPRGPIVLP
eukprot:c48108_g1_i1 orf=406-1542(-)